MTQWTAFAHSMAAAFTAILLVSAALRAVIGHMVQSTTTRLPSIDVLRYSTGSELHVARHGHDDRPSR